MLVTEPTPRKCKDCEKIFSDDNRLRCTECRLKNIERKDKARNTHKLVNLAIKTGHLVRPTNCSKCKSADSLFGHHDDYDKPLDVVWFCRKCHAARHIELGSYLR